MIPVEWQALFALVVFVGLIVALVLDLVDLAIAGMLAVSLLLVGGVLATADLRSATNDAGPTLALLFGGMVLVRILTPTGLFDGVGYLIVRGARGSGARLLIAIAAAAVPTCAFLPNATVILLFAPIVILACKQMEMDPIAPLVLLVAIANTAGLLTEVGDPATFIVASGIGMSFETYLTRVTPFSVLVLAALMLASLVVLRASWRARIAEAPQIERPRLHRPIYIVLALAIFALQVFLFVTGEARGITPPVAAFVCATLGLLVVYSLRVESMSAILADIDWRTLIFIACMFMMVQGLVHTGWLQGGADLMTRIFGTNIALAAIAMIWVVGILSMVLPNVPVVIGLLLIVKGYLVHIEAVPEEALGAGFADWPDATLPIFIGMMFGGTMGGNATMIGAAGNIVAVGIAQRAGYKITFLGFLRIGLPLTVAQLLVATGCILGLVYLR
jgi:Na+/H+ antiporter NhaD/arsenite permease-like protein